MEYRLFRRIIQIKWQAILLRMNPFPPRILWTDHILPRSKHRFPLLNKDEFLKPHQRYFFYTFICFRLFWLDVRKEWEKWRKNTGKIRNTRISAIRNVNFSPATKERIQKILTACSVIALFMHLGDKCGGNFRYTEKGIKDCTNCQLPHKRKNYGYVTGKYQELAALMQEIREEKRQHQSRIYSRLSYKSVR